MQGLLQIQIEQKTQQIPSFKSRGYVSYSWTLVRNPIGKCAFKDCPLGELQLIN